VIEIRLRAERAGAGQLLAETERAKGGNPNLSWRATGSKTSATLSELGINRHRSSRWRKLAGVLEPARASSLFGPAVQALRRL
jgi:hypothetical protein